MADKPQHILIIEARFYEELSEELLRGATAAVESAGATFEQIAVPGALEIPAALAMALEARERGSMHFDGVICLGCVIRGETKHFDIVAEQSARALIDLATDESLALGNGILTVENEEQAWERARVGGLNKGGAAAEATLTMVALRKRLGI